MTKRTNCHFFFDEETNELVHIFSYYVTRVKKSTRAGKYGKDIFCPFCRNQITVHHFNWSSHICDKCEREIDKYDWFARSDPRKFSKRLTLCDPKVKYYIDKDSVGKTDEHGTALDVKYSPKSINSHF